MQPGFLRMPLPRERRLTHLYFWLKACHVVSVIAWMAALLYLPRLYVYHADAEPGSDMSETFKAMERRLQKAIMTPAMLASVALGAVLAALPGVVDWTAGWVWLKVGMIAGLLVFHGFLMRWRGDFEKDANLRSGRFYRAVNEVPAILMIVIVVSVVVKPF